MFSQHLRLFKMTNELKRVRVCEEMTQRIRLNKVETLKLYTSAAGRRLEGAGRVALTLET